MAQIFRIPKIQLIDNMKFKNKEDLCGCYGTYEKGNKILSGVNIEIKYRAETEGKFI